MIVTFILVTNKDQDGSRPRKPRVFALLGEDPPTRLKSTYIPKGTQDQARRRRARPPTVPNSWKEKSSVTALVKNQTKIQTKNQTPRTSPYAINWRPRFQPETLLQSYFESSFEVAWRLSLTTMDNSMLTRTSSLTCMTKSAPRYGNYRSSRKESIIDGSSRNDHRSGVVSPKEGDIRPPTESSSAEPCGTR
jgi:hypothetical protein